MNSWLGSYFEDKLLIAHCSLLITSYFCSPNHSFGTFREVAEWSNATDSKSVIPARVSGVRIPPSLQKAFSALERAFFIVYQRSSPTQRSGRVVDCGGLENR